MKKPCACIWMPYFAACLIVVATVTTLGNIFNLRSGE
jgi:hypothetical protein